MYPILEALLKTISNNLIGKYDLSIFAGFQQINAIFISLRVFIIIFLFRFFISSKFFVLFSGTFDNNPVQT